MRWSPSMPSGLLPRSKNESSQGLEELRVDAQRLAYAGDGELNFALGRPSRGNELPAAFFALDAEFFRRVDHGGVFTDKKHREVRVAV